jgi:hypothetical protein
MEELHLTVIELYELRAQIFGLTKDGQPIYHGFTNQLGVPESLKRAATRIGKSLTAEIELVDNQRKEAATYTEEGKTEEELAAIRKAKDLEIINDPTKIVVMVQKLDFAPIADKDFAPNNYQFIYDKIFKD